MLPATDPRYPIGAFEPPEGITSAHRSAAIGTLADLPHRLRSAVGDLSPDQIDTPYREGGWTLREVVHHVADSHATALFRVKKALTEEWPLLPGYQEAEFAKLPDTAAPVELSLPWIASVHGRWVMLLQALTEEQWRRGFRHAERGPQVLDIMTLHYAWHSLHHVAHVTNLRVAKGW